MSGHEPSCPPVVGQGHVRPPSTELQARSCCANMSEARLPIPSRLDAQGQPVPDLGRPASTTPQGAQSATSSMLTQGRLSPFGEALSSHRFSTSRTEDNLLYKVRASIAEGGSDSDSDSDSQASGAAPSRPPVVIRPPGGAPHQSQAPVNRRWARTKTLRDSGAGLAIAVARVPTEKNFEAEALADAADGWDQEGPAPRRPKEIVNRDSDQQHLWVLDKIRKLTESLHQQYVQHAQMKINRKSRRFKTAPSSVASPLSSSSTPMSQSPVEEPLRPLVIFDWDDTLFPTWYVTEVIQTTLPAGHHKYSRLPEDSPHFESLAAHAQLVSETLQIAASFGTVAIVTLAARPWVDNSAEWFLPGVDLPEVLLNLDIPVFYAREHVRKTEKVAARVEEGVDLFMIAKRNAMKRCIRKLCPNADKIGNVICIGDSTTEELAIKEIMWSDDSGLAQCKTIKLLDDPTLEVLGMELQLVTSWFEKMIPHGDDFHISLNDTGSKLVWE